MISSSGPTLSAAMVFAQSSISHGSDRDAHGPTTEAIPAQNGLLERKDELPEVAAPLYPATGKTWKPPHRYGMASPLILGIYRGGRGRGQWRHSDPAHLLKHDEAERGARNPEETSAQCAS